MYKNIVIVSTFLFCVSSFAAMTPEEQQKYNSWVAYINDTQQSYAQYPIDMCGRKMDITMDASLVTPFVAAGANAELYCEEFRTKLSTMCRNAASLNNNNKEKINKLIQTINCMAAPKEDDVLLEIKGGVLIAKIGPKSSDLSDKLLKYMDTVFINSSTAPTTDTKKADSKKTDLKKVLLKNLKK